MTFLTDPQAIRKKKIRPDFENIPKELLLGINKSNLEKEREKLRLTPVKRRKIIRELRFKPPGTFSLWIHDFSYLRCRNPISKEDFAVHFELNLSTRPSHFLQQTLETYFIAVAPLQWIFSSKSYLTPILIPSFGFLNSSSFHSFF